MLTIKAHFDGRVFVPDEPIDLVEDQEVILRLETVDPPKKTDFRTLIGMADHGPINPNPRFKSDDDLWKKD